MRFALLGHDEFTAEIAEALRQSGHEVTSIWDAEPLRGKLTQLFPRARWLASWSTLLESPEVDVTVVARGMDDEARADQLRRLAQTGATTLVSHPLHPSVLIYFELEMICAESKARLVPYCPWRWQPGVERLAEWIADDEESPVGACEQLVIERAAAARDTESVTRLFVRDVDLAMRLVGDLNSLSAMAPGWETGGLGNLGVQMTGPAGISVRWSISPVESAPGVRVSVIGADGKATLTIPDSSQSTELQVRAGGQSQSEKFATDDLASDALRDLVDLEGEPSVSPNWHLAARGMELADSIEISLRKGKTIPLYNTAPSEQGTFKGIMAAAGCFLLFASLAMVMIGVLLGQFGFRIANKIPFAIAAILIAFLLLQSLRFAFPRSA